MPDRKITWYPAGCDPNAPDGTEIVLQGDPLSPFQEVDGAADFFLSPWTIFEDATPGADGTRFRGVQKQARDPQFRFLCVAPTAVEVVEAMQQLAASLVGARLPGVLEIASRVGTDAGDVRQIRCLYSDGLRGDLSLARVSRTKQAAFTLTWRAFDPYWYTTDAATASWAGFTSTPTFPIAWPMTFAPYGVQLTKLLDLTGNVESYGTYTLAGPWSRVRFTNDRTQQCWELQRELASETVVVTTKPGSSNSVVNLAGDNRYGLLTYRDYFAIAPHSPARPCDTISVQVDGATGATAFTLEVPPAWLTAP